MRRYLELRCPQCSHVTQCGPEQLLLRLQQIGMLRRVKDPEWQLLCELAPSAAERLACPQCEHIGLLAGEDRADDDDDWGIGRSCAACGKPIPPERVELYPDAKLCATCQQSQDAGAVHDDPEYCPKCGALMTVRQTRGAGITRYVSVCSECRR